MPAQSNRLPEDSQERKDTPLCTGVLDYFPDALAAVARLSKIGNDKHNPGQPLHWSREKSDDHADCILRHMLDRGTVDTDGELHDVKVAWRALAQCQLAIEKQRQVAPAAPIARSYREAENEQRDGVHAVMYCHPPLRALPELEEKLSVLPDVSPVDITPDARLVAAAEWALPPVDWATRHAENDVRKQEREPDDRGSEGYWYLASPYSKYLGGGHIGHACAALHSRALAAKCMKAGVRVFAPIHYTHDIAYEELPDETHTFWMDQDWPMIRASNGILVAQLDGWDESSGIKREIEFCVRNRLPIVYWPDPLNTPPPVGRLQKGP